MILLFFVFSNCSRLKSFDDNKSQLNNAAWSDTSNLKLGSSKWDSFFNSSFICWGKSCSNGLGIGAWKCAGGNWTFLYCTYSFTVSIISILSLEIMDDLGYLLNVNEHDGT